MSHGRSDGRKVSAKGDQTSAIVRDGAQRRQRQGQALRDLRRAEQVSLARSRYKVDPAGRECVMDAAVLADHIVHGEYLSESFGDALGALSSEAISDEEAERFADQLVVGGALRAALQILLQSRAQRFDARGSATKLCVCVRRA